MTGWSKDATEFVVSVTFGVRSGSSYSCVPKPILDKLGNPKAIKFTIQKDQIMVSRSDS